MSTSRRTFLAAAGAAMAWTGAKVRGANDDVRLAVIGISGKGDQHINLFNALPGVRVVSLCDPDRKVLAERSKMYNVSPEKSHTDLRRVFDDKEVDAVVIATPNHWHALATIWACQAGKDVYVEKPISYNIWEGQQMIAAARKHNRIVQGGTQRRSDEGLAAGFAALQKGELGKILRVRAVIFRTRDSIGKVASPVPPPSHVDYNLWAGPAPQSPLMRKKFHYDWHWFWETGNGELGNNGPHVLDLSRWVLGQNALPPRVFSIGGRYGWDDSGQTPNTHCVYYDYQPAPILIEIRNLPEKTGSKNSDHYKGNREGIVIECEGGYLSCMNGGVIYDNDGKKIRNVDGDGGRHHQANFIKALRGRKAVDQKCDIAEAHLSTALCHMGNISHHLGQSVSPREAREAMKSNALAGEGIERLTTHLAANGVSTDTSKITLGPRLDFDPTKQVFTGPLAEQANAHLRRAYREPFVVPEAV